MGGVSKERAHVMKSSRKTGRKKNEEISSLSAKKTDAVKDSTTLPAGAANWMALKKTLKQKKKLHGSEKQKSIPAADKEESKDPSALPDSRKTLKRKRKLEQHESNGPSTKKERKENDIWFDDLDVKIVDGKVLAKQTVPTKELTNKTALVTGTDTSPTHCIALDCEMVMGGVRGAYKGSMYPMLARCSIVNCHGNVLYDKYVKPVDRIVDYVTRLSGIKPIHLKDAPTFFTVQKEVSALLANKILVGHALCHDLKVLFLAHDRRLIRDTSTYAPFKQFSKGNTPSLKGLAKELLGLDIQCGTHDSVEDARVAMKLYQLHKNDWEKSISQRKKVSHDSHVKPLSQATDQSHQKPPSRWKVRKLAQKKKGKLKDRRQEAREELKQRAAEQRIDSTVCSNMEPFHIMLNSDL